MNTRTGAAVAPTAPRTLGAGLTRRGSPRRRCTLALALVAALAVSGCLGACGDSSTPNAGALLRDTFSSHEPIASGRVELSLALAPPRSTGAAGKAMSFSLHLAGPFQGTGAGRPPSFALALTIAEGGRTQSAGAVATGGRLYLRLGGVAFLAPASTQRALEQGYAQTGASSRHAGGQPSIATLGIDPHAWLTHASPAGSAEIAGEPTIHLVAGLDATRFLADAGRLQSAGEALTGSRSAAPLTPARIAALSGAVHAARVDVYTGAHDHLLRRLALSAEVLPVPGSRAAPGGLAGETLTFALQFSQLNRPQSIAPPSSPQPVSRLAGVLERLASARAPGG